LESVRGDCRKTITLTDQQDDWIKAQVEGGHYTNDSDASVISLGESKSAVLRSRQFARR
jgi:antitoxin ParD1/3/4